MAILELIDVSKSFGEKKCWTIFPLPSRKDDLWVYWKKWCRENDNDEIDFGVAKKDAGTIKVNDETVHYGQTKTNRWIGYLPDIPMFYDYLTAEEYLQLCGEITEMPKHKIQQKRKSY